MADSAHRSFVRKLGQAWWPRAPLGGSTGRRARSAGCSPPRRRGKRAKLARSAPSSRPSSFDWAWSAAYEGDGRDPVEVQLTKKAGLLLWYDSTLSVRGSSPANLEAHERLRRVLLCWSMRRRGAHLRKSQCGLWWLKDQGGTVSFDPSDARLRRAMAVSPWPRGDWMSSPAGLPNIGPSRLSDQVTRPPRPSPHIRYGACKQTIVLTLTVRHRQFVKASPRVR